MNYFDKIEAYTTGTLSEMECLVFETALTQNSALQQELAAFQLAQDLFGFLGDELSETEIETSDSVSLADALIGFTAINLSEAQILASDTIATTESVKLADSLIDFTATNLSEAQILATQPIVEQTPIIRRLQPRTNRTAWLAAASMLFILSLIGSPFYTSQNTGQNSTNIAEVTPIEKAPIKAIIPISNIDKEEIIAATIPEKTIQEKSYPPAKVRIIKKELPITIISPISTIQEVAMNDTEVLMKKKVVESPLATNTVAQEITTSAIIPKGQAIAYRATNSITLKSGFSAHSGTSFIAETTQKAAPQEVNSNTVISKKESVLLKANTSITLKPGFHAKVGATFKAEIGK